MEKSLLKNEYLDEADNEHNKLKSNEKLSGKN